MHDKAVHIYLFLIDLLETKCLKHLTIPYFLIIFCHDVDSYIITFLKDGMVFKIMDFNINLDNDDRFDEDDPER